MFDSTGKPIERRHVKANVMMAIWNISISLLFLSHLVCKNAYGLDTFILDRPQSVLDNRKDYPALLLKEVLEQTRSVYGPYEISLAYSYMERDRQLIELKRGKLVNVIATPSQPSWEQNLVAIKIPIDMGLQSWRVGLINKSDQARFRAIQTLDELKRVPVGVGLGWSSLAILTKNNFNVVPGNNFDGMFDMLRLKRFDYFLRGVNEVFPELEARRADNPNIALEETILIHVPLPWLFFVSPKTPNFAVRITTGLEAMVKSGSLRRFMLKHHEDFLKLAKLCNRRTFEVPNENVSAEFLERKEVWFNPLDPINGFCHHI